MKSRGIVLSLLSMSVLFCSPAGKALRVHADELRVVHERVGVMGTGSNMFRSALVHSSGVIFIGTYGPQPAILWKYDPKLGTLEKIGTPGEYQLDSMVEAPNGMVYIGTAYEALVYRLDPRTNEIKNLGTPPIDSTKWIFTMIRTKSGEIYGAKGVGLFRLDWKTDTFESIGVAPGDHTTLGPDPSSPIIRELVETPSGMIYGDTNRWLFRFDPAKERIEPLVDMLKIDPSCFALFLPHGGVNPTEDCYFALFTRFTGDEVKEVFYVYRADTGRLDSLPIDGFRGKKVFHPAWYVDQGQNRLLTPVWTEEQQRLHIALIDPFKQRLIETWNTDATIGDAVLIPGGGLYFRTSAPAGLLKADPEQKRLTKVAENPIAADCRCLASSPQGLLGTDTWDCGHAFTLNPDTGEGRDHGKVWHDDHRCFYGPAAFAGHDGRYFVANHSQSVPALWTTDTSTNRHWKIGPSAIQLVAMSDGSVWGTTGPHPNVWKFDPEKCWTPSWHAREGDLFRYLPGASDVEFVRATGKVGPVAEAPRDVREVRQDGTTASRALVVQGKKLCVVDPTQPEFVAELELEDQAIAMTNSAKREAVYVLLANGNLKACYADGARHVLTDVADNFGMARAVERGFFTLPLSNRLVGVAADGVVTSCDPRTGKIARAHGPRPRPAGPAVSPKQDCWYYADREVFRFSLPR